MLKKKDIYLGKDYKKLYKNNFGKRNWLLSENIKININCDNSELNNNVIVIGGAGTGKGYNVILPNLLEANTNYVVIDVNGDLYQKTNIFFKKKGYSTKVLDFSNRQNEIDLKDKVSYTPFKYIKKNSEIPSIVDAFMNATNGTLNNELLEMSERNLLISCIKYLLEQTRSDSYVTFNSIYELLNKFEIDLDCYFEKIHNLLSKDKTDILTPSNFIRIKLMDRGIILAIINSVKSRLEVFRNVNGYDSFNDCTCDLNSLTKNKQIIYIELSMCDTSFNFLIPIIHRQIVRLLNNCDDFQTEYHTKFIFDEFVDIYGMDDVVCYMKNQNTKKSSYMFITQNFIQLKKAMPNEWDDLLCECDSMLFMGSHNFETAKYISNRLENKMSESEIIKMDNGKCIAFIVGSKPVIDSKYNVQKHKNYKQIK